ncbi:MAG: GTP cyclohydrolase II, partial [Pseudohongiella sp.]
LLTNNPVKVAALTSLGIKVTERVPIETGLNSHNESYLAVKVSKMGHLLRG